MINAPSEEIGFTKLIVTAEDRGKGRTWESVCNGIWAE